MDWAITFAIAIASSCGFTLAFAQTSTPAAPLQSVNNQILQMNNNLATQPSTPVPTATVAEPPNPKTLPLAPSLTQ
jgi:hypothetical protein